MSQPRNHHYIPVFYLKQWLGEGTEFVSYSRPYPGVFKKRRLGPRGIGFQRDLYTFPGLPPELAQYLEQKFLQKADSAAAAVLETLLVDGADQEWTAETRSAWARFLANFFVRHPDPFAEVREAVHDLALRITDDTQAAYEAVRQPDDPPLFREWVENHPANLADQIRMRFVQGLLDNVSLGQRIFQLAGIVLDLSDADTKLLTSDWPIDHSFGQEHEFVGLPISPTAYFLGTNSEEFRARIRRFRPNEFVELVNSQTVERARRFVISADDSADAFVEARMSRRMQRTPFFPNIRRGV